MMREQVKVEYLCQEIKKAVETIDLKYVWDTTGEGINV